MSSSRAQDPSPGYGDVVALVGIALALIALPWPRAALGAALIGCIFFVWRRAYIQAPRNDIAQAMAAIVTVVFATAFLVSVLLAGDEADVDSMAVLEPAHEASPGKIIQVDNRTTSGMRFQKDDQPVWLLKRPVGRCPSSNCIIRGTERDSGGSYDAAVCQTMGDVVTNSDLSSTTDDSNPHQFESPRYYGVRLAGSDVFGYVSEVWIRRQDRGGLGLPHC